MFLRKTLPAVLVVIALSACLYAQQPEATAHENANPQQDGPRKSGRHGRMGRPGFGFVRELNLTEEQRQQQRAIVQRRLGDTKAQREELFRLREKRIAGTFSSEDGVRAQTLRKEIRDSMDGMRTEVEGVLTADQKARLEQLKTEHKTRMGERRERRRERHEQRDEMPQ